MMILRILLILFMVCLMATNSAYADKDIKLISPLEAVIRSTVIPGYGQFYIGKKIHGIFFFFLTY